MRFSNNPPTTELYCFPIIRPRHRHPIAFTIGTPELRGCYTHWFGGKTIACSKPATCEACEVNVKSVWQGHVLAHRHEDDAIVMVVFTLPVKEFLMQHKLEETGIYGVKCRLIRMGGRETGPIGCQFLGRLDKVCMIKMTALEKVVTRLYADNSNKRRVDLER